MKKKTKKKATKKPGYTLGDFIDNSTELFKTSLSDLLFSNLDTYGNQSPSYWWLKAVKVIESDFNKWKKEQTK